MLRFFYVLLLGGTLCWLGACTGSAPADPEAERLARAKAIADSIAALPRAQVQIQTTQGTMVVELYNETPQHRDNFLKLVQTGFYDSLLLHRVQPNFMVQGGDPDSRGTVPPEQFLGMGQLDYTIPAEFKDQFILRHGALCGYHNNAPDKASHGSQFMLIHGQPLRAYQVKALGLENNRAYTAEQLATYEQYGGLPQYDNKYTVFGQIIEGNAVLDRLVAVPTHRSVDPSLPDRPLEDIHLIMTILQEGPSAPQ